MSQRSAGSRRLTPTKATLVMAGVGTIALMGVPGFGHYDPPRGPIEGVVIDDRGYAVPEAQVALFDDHALSLLEIVTSDARGRFAFHQAPERYAVYADQPGSDLVGAWITDRERGPLDELELTLDRGIPVEVQVRDEKGRPLPGAEVRVYDAGQRSAVVSRVLTGSDGTAHLAAPEQVHLAVKHPQHPERTAWRLQHEVQPDETLGFKLHVPREVRGRVVDEAENPVSGVVVTGWEGPERAQWCGYALTEPDGTFRLKSSAGSVRVRVADPDQRHLPLVTDLAPWKPGDQLPQLTLGAGVPLVLRCSDDGDAVPARVWVWSEETRAWSWGTRTTPAGELHVQAGSNHSVVAYPTSRSYRPVEAWDLTHQSLPLELTPARAP